MVLLKPVGFALTSKVTAFCSVSLFSVHSAALCPDYYALPGKLEADISDGSPGAKSKSSGVRWYVPLSPISYYSHN